MSIHSMQELKEQLGGSNRFQIMDLPFATPGKCVVCGSPGGDGRKFIDIGFELDFYGVIYFCDLCLTNGVNTLGWLSPDQANTAIHLNNLLENEVLSLKGENERLRTALTNLSDVFGISINTDPPVDFGETVVETAKPNDSTPDTTKSKPAKSSNVGGPKNPPKFESVDEPSSDVDLDLDFLEL